MGPPNEVGPRPANQGDPTPQQSPMPRVTDRAATNSEPPPTDRRLHRPHPPLPFAEDFIGNILLIDRVTEALLNGAPVTMFDWTAAPSLEDLETALNRWDETRKPKPRKQHQNHLRCAVDGS